VSAQVYTRGLPYNEVVRKPKRRTLYIKNPKAHSLAEKVSKKMGLTLTDAVIHSLEQQLRGPARPINLEKVAAIQREIGSLLVHDTRTDDEIIGYDEFGIPR
jgi:antitoxin VapB